MIDCRSYVLILWLAPFGLFAGACAIDSPGTITADGENGGEVNPTLEVTREDRAALTPGSGSVGDCNGNPARCTAVYIAAGAQYTVALKSGGPLWSWGDNGDGQLGDNTVTPKLAPTPVSVPYDLAAVAAGESHTVALSADGVVLTWGRNGNGQLGDGTTDEHHTPIQVLGLSGVIAVAAGFRHSVALKSDGTVRTWGLNTHGQIGDGTKNERLVQTLVKGLNGVTAIAAGAFHTLALTSDGTVLAWGFNDHGQLGTNTTTEQLQPVPVLGLSGVTAVAAGDLYSVALKSDGTVWAWGDNIDGQLGDNTTIEKLSPTLVGGLPGNNIIAIAAGTDHAVALRSLGKVWAWGRNSNGQLGDNTTTQRLIPVEVADISGVVAISAGTFHTVAVKADGSVWTWGANLHGQLGDNTTTEHLAPTRATDLRLSPECRSAMSQCDQVTGSCVAAPPLKNGTACSDSNACTIGDICKAGVCKGHDSVICTAADLCHAAGACNSSTGVCSVQPPLVCPVPDECHESGICDTNTGTCSSPAKSDGSSCSVGACQAGICKKIGRTVDLSCHFGIESDATSAHGSWLGTIALLALRRRRVARASAKPQSPRSA